MANRCWKVEEPIVANLLFVDDDETVLALLESATDPRHSICSCTSAEQALTQAQLRLFDVAVLDVHLPGMSGLNLIPHLLRLCPGISIFVMTGAGTIEIAVDAMKRGAQDFLAKPISITHLQNLIEVALSRKQTGAKTESGEAVAAESKTQMIATAPKMQHLLAQVEAIAPYNTTVLVTGETGSGKELLVRAIHSKSPRARRPFVALNCAAIPEHLLEDELFGHVKGAYTGAIQPRDGRFEQANGGTLFLDEIGDMSLPLQSKLLRVLQERTFEKLGSARSVKVDVRVVAATSANLEKRIEEGQFRADLYYRLNVMRLSLPPLRDRREDIRPMANFFLSRFCESVGLPTKTINDSVWPVLTSYDWAGNVRQLQNAMERAAALSGAATTILIRDLPDEIQRTYVAATPPVRTYAPAPEIQSPVNFEAGIDFEAVVSSFERDLLTRALEKTSGNKLQAARLLNMKRTTFLEKLKKYSIGGGQ